MSDETPYRSKIDRRTALAWVGAVGAAAAVGESADETSGEAPEPGAE
jgi:hypothetical protein